MEIFLLALSGWGLPRGFGTALLDILQAIFGPKSLRITSREILNSES